MARPFVAKDGRDAEVWVQTGTGIVGDITRKEKTANVSFKVEGLKHRIHGWISLDDPVFALAEEAHSQGKEVNFRIESQRKKDVDISIPIEELRETMEKAKENTIIILAAINGQLSKEAVTIPENDPVTGDRVRATPKAEATVSPAASSNGRAHATEEPAWRPFNSDGRPNLGSYAMSGIIGAESTARSYLVEQGIVNPAEFGTPEVESKVIYVTRALLDISDKAQTSSPELLNKADRNASSHTRARSVVYDTLKYVPFDATSPQDWKQKVEDLSIARFQAIIALLSDSLGGGSNDAPRNQGSAPSAPSASSAPARQATVESNASIFQPHKVNPDAPKAAEETVEALKELVTESNVEDMRKVSRLLAWTFGTPKAADVSDELLGEMLDFYMSQENPEENFLAVLDTVWARTQQ